MDDKPNNFIDMLNNLYNKHIPIMEDKISAKFPAGYVRDHYSFQVKRQVEQLFYTNVISNIMDKLQNSENIKSFNFTDKDIKKIQFQEVVILGKIKEIDFNDWNTITISKKEYHLFADSIKKVS